MTVHKENTELLDCKITRGRRPDVVERRHLDDDYKNQEIGFSISAAFLENSRGIVSYFIFVEIPQQRLMKSILKHSVKSRNPKDSGDAIFHKRQRWRTQGRL